jgi:hypothetical protein
MIQILNVRDSVFLMRSSENVAEYYLHGMLRCKITVSACVLSFPNGEMELPACEIRIYVLLNYLTTKYEFHTFNLKCSLFVGESNAVK